MDVFGRYVAQRAASAAKYAQVRAQQQAFAQQAAARAAGTVVQQAAAPAVRQVASGGGGGYSGGGGFSGIGQAAAAAAQQAAASPAIFTPQPPVETFGQRMARSIVEQAERAQQVVAPPPAQTLGQRLAEQILMAPGVNPNTGEQAPEAVPPIQSRALPEQFGPGLYGGNYTPPMPMPGVNIPDTGSSIASGYDNYFETGIDPVNPPVGTGGNVVPRVGSRQRPDWQNPANSPLTNLGIMARQAAAFNADEPPRPRPDIRDDPNVTQMYQQGGSQRGILGFRQETQAPVQGPSLGTNPEREQAKRDLVAGMDAAAANYSPTGPTPVRTGPDRRTPGGEGGGLDPNAPYIVVRSGRTGEVYTIDRSRAANLGPGDVILGTAGEQPASDRDRGANDAAAEVWDSVRGTVGGVVNDVTRTVRDMAYLGKVIARNPQVTTALEGVFGGFMDDWNEQGPATAIVNLLKDGAGIVLDAADVAREINTTNAIDAYIKLKTGTYDPGEEEELLDAAGLLTLTITGEVQSSLGMVDIQVDEARGVVSAGSVGFGDWYEGTSTVVYADGTTYTVRNQDIENNPDKFTDATIYANDERANTAYTDGIDTDGDGTADTFGAEAVQLLYEADQGIAGTFIWQVGMDPLTYIPFVTVGGAKVESIGRAVRVRSATNVGEGIGRGVETVGTVIKAGSRAIDEASSLGAGIVLDKVVAPVMGRVGRGLRVLNESNASRQITEQAEAGAVGGGIANRADERLTPGGEGAPSVTTTATRGATTEAEASAERGIDRRTSGGEGQPSVLQPEEPPAAVVDDTANRPAPPVARSSGDFDRGPDLRTPDGGTIPTRVADGEGGIVTRAVDDSGVRAVARENSTFPPREVRTPAGKLDASGVPPRYDELLVRSARDAGVGPTQVLTDTWRASGRFIDNVNAQRVIGTTARTSEGTVDAALRTANDAYDWQRDLRALNPATPEPRFIVGGNQTVEHRAASRIIGDPWDTTAAERNRLYRLPTDSPNAIRKVIPANPTPGDLAAAERYADMVDAHVLWHPMDAASPQFQAARVQASRIRQQLRDLGYEGRGGIARGAGRAVNVAPNGRAAAIDAATVTPAPADGARATPTGVQPNGSRAVSESDLGSVGGYPVEDEFATGSGLGLRVRLDADTTVDVVPVPQRQVPTEVRREFPDYADTPTWHRGYLIDEAVEVGTVVRFAPDPDTVVARLADDARARGLLDETTEATPTPEPPAPTPLPAPRPNGQTPRAATTTTTAPTPIRPEVAAMPDALPQPLRDAIAAGQIADEATARSLLNNVAAPRGWTDDDLRVVIAAMDELRRADGRTLPLAEAIDLANPEVRRWLRESETLARQTRAVQMNEAIVRNPGVSKSAKAGANARLKQLKADLAKTRTGLGLDPSTEGTLLPSMRTRLASEDEATTLLGRLVPPGKRERAYLANLKKLRTVEFGQPTRGLVVDGHGMAYFHGAVLTDDEVAALTKYTFADGDTFLDRWNVYLTDVVGGRRGVLQGSDPIRTALDMTMRDYRELIEGLFPARQTPKILKPLEVATRYLREKILGSWLSGPRYVGTQALGNTINLGLAGYGGRGWVDMLAGVRRSWRETHEMGRLLGADAFDYDRTILNSDRLTVKWGASRAPEIRRHVSSETDITRDAGVVEGWLRRHDLPGTVPARAIFGDTRLIKMGGAFDMAARDTVYSIAFQRRIREGITDFRRRANDVLMEAGHTRRQAVEIVEAFKRTHPDGFTSNDVRAFFRDYVGEGKAERLGRDWQTTVNGTTKYARDEVKRVTFAGGETKLDAALKPVVLFHYFMSRQYLFLVRQALHHPGLINAYEAATQALEDYAEANDLPPWLAGTLQFVFAGPGLALYLNPTALLQVGNLFAGADDIFEDENWLSGQLDQIGEYLFVNPIFTDALNLFGFLGDSRDLDPLRLMREAQVFQLAFNWGVHGGWIPGVENLWLGNPVTNVGNKLRSAVAGLLPGSEEIAFVNEAEAEQRELHALVVDEAVAAGIDPNTPEGAAQIAAILEDPTSDIYRRAQERYLWGETYAVGARLIPIVASFRPQVRMRNDRGEDLILGRSDSERTLSNTTDERALRVKVQAGQYYNLGSEDIRNVDFIYQDLVYSDQVFFDITIDGVRYEHDDIEKMTAEERRMLGQAFLAQYGQRERWQAYQAQQTAFLADPDNREFAQYKTWQRALFDYPGGVEQYWKDAIEQNENARAYYEGLDPTLSAKERQKALSGTWAFYAVAGIAGTYTVALKPTNGYDPVNVANAPAQPIIPEPYVNEWQQETVEEVESYQRYRSEAEVVLQQIYADWGLPPDTSLGTVPYKTRQAIEKEYKARTGYYPPEPGSKAEKYFKWRDEHPGGTLEEYFAWDEQQYEANLPQNFNEDQARPEGEAMQGDAYDLWSRDEFRGN